MQQAINAAPVISAPAEGDTRYYGPYQVTLSLTVDNAFSINVHARTGGHRYDELCFTTADVDTANLVHRIIKDGGEQGVQPEGIREALDAALREELLQVQERHDTPSRNRVEHINLVLDRLEQPVDTARMDELAATLGRPRNMRELRDAMQAGINRQRAEVAAR
ncbi:hypothetical protein ACGFIW_01365 [Micromonospora sp. NPDC048935]|uniref:hypothetical protein n=1 Tax=Micromonospora sp. NPDC048935 TaxID=3364262 RepID=UPI0037234E8F